MAWLSYEVNGVLSEKWYRGPTSVQAKRGLGRLCRESKLSPSGDYKLVRQILERNMESKMLRHIEEKLVLREQSWSSRGRSQVKQRYLGTAQSLICCPSLPLASSGPHHSHPYVFRTILKPLFQEAFADNHPRISLSFMLSV